MYIRTCTSTVLYIIRTYDTEEDLRILKGPKLEIFGSRVFTKLRPVWWVTQELNRKIQNLDGFGLKIDILNFLALSPIQLKNILTTVGDGVKNFSVSVLTRCLTRSFFKCQRTPDCSYIFLNFASHMPDSLVSMSLVQYSRTVLTLDTEFEKN